MSEALLRSTDTLGINRNDYWYQPHLGLEYTPDDDAQKYVTIQEPSISEYWKRHIMYGVFVTT